jgi:glycerol-3-phosphate dehydrogenase (NAD(P)+)
MSSNVGIIGAGAWGTAVAKVIADKGHNVAIWGHEEQTANNINKLHENSQFKNIDDLIARIAEVGYLPEGVVAAKYMKTLIKENKLKMPISLSVYKILNKEINAKELLNGILKEM